MSLNVFVEASLMMLALTNCCRINTIKLFSFSKKNGAAGFSDLKKVKNL